MIESDNINESIWRSMKSISSAWAKIGEKKLNEFGIGVMEYRVLKTLRLNGPLPMIRIAEKNMITQGWVTSLVDRLEEMGMVRRIRNSEDRRVVTIEPTPEGISLYNSVKTVHQAFVSESLSSLEQEEKHSLLRLLSSVEKSVAGEKKKDLHEESRLSSVE